MIDCDDRLLRIENKVDKLVDGMSLLRERTARLEVKAAIWGLVGGGLAAAIAFLPAALK